MRKPEPPVIEIAVTKEGRSGRESFALDEVLTAIRAAFYAASSGPETIVIRMEKRPR